MAMNDCDLTAKEKATLKLFLAKQAAKFERERRLKEAADKIGETYGFPDWLEEYCAAIENKCPKCNGTGSYEPGWWIFKKPAVVCPRCNGQKIYVGRPK